MEPHPRPAVERSFTLSIALTSLILLAEVAGGIWTGSLALLSDAAHVFMDVFALTLSFVALRLSALPPDDRHTYGYHRLEVLAALINGVTLGIIAIGIFWEAAARWGAPEPIKSVEMMIIAVIGLVVNMVVAFVLGGHQHEHDEHEQEDMNVQSAFLHVVGDAVSSVGVIVAAGIIWFTGWYWVDVIASVLIGLIILLGSWRVLRPTLHLLMEGVPEGLGLTRIGATLAAAPAVREVHDLHVWSLCAGHVALSAHVVVDDQPLGDTAGLMAELKRGLAEAFGITHTTIQIECATCGQGRSVRP
jgi:cobalt-zinc-cadmium efflux system protein